MNPNPVTAQYSDLKSSRVVYSRHMHGSQKIHFLGSNASGIKYLVEGGGAYRTAKDLLRHFYGKDTKISVDEYFKIGRHRKPNVKGKGDILSTLGAKPRTRPEIRPNTSPRKVELPELLRLDSASEQEYEKKIRLELDRLQGRVGIDLGMRSNRKGATFVADEVRKLLWKGFGGKMISQGYDPEDVLQEVYRGLIVRNKGKCPWDARKSSFGHYVFMVINGVLANYHRKQTRRIVTYPIAIVEGGSGTVMPFEGEEDGDRIALETLQSYFERKKTSRPEEELGVKILPLVAAGMQRGEIARETGEKIALVSRALAWVRKETAIWAQRGGMEYKVPIKYKDRKLKMKSKARL